tara:strand:- start:9 stop:698 length:690 start_codon:yes stop_codon:yes gene_type:complete
MSDKNNRTSILKILQEKAVVKKDVFEKTKEVFDDLKKVIQEFSKTLAEDVKVLDMPLKVASVEKGKYEIRLTIAGDVLVFMMHSNVFDFEKTHKVHRTSYVKKDKGNSYCGMINVYNFLADSFKYNRVNDSGYLVGRIFINQDLHFFVEGKKEIGFLFNDFQNSKFDNKAKIILIETIVKHCLSFELFTPPYHEVAQVSVDQIETASTIMKMKTGKRLGFHFNADDDVF